MKNNHINSLIEQMKSPTFYNHKTLDIIETIQTHISYVFLTGEFAYKIKKSVKFTFLDFTTINLRKHFLNEEMRMNSMIAPEIYLEVLPITKLNNIYSLGGTGEIVEYVLKMRQFSQKNLLSNMFTQGKLTEEDLKQLGKTVAQFHAITETNDYIRSFGTTKKIREAIEENYQNTSKYIGILQEQKQYEETKNFTDKFIVKNEQIFKARLQQDKIRECHGDLHLRNICLWSNKILLFDRIEFNEPFRFVDVFYDVAFTVMDLDAKGRKDFGNIFLNTYIEETGDWEGVQVLPLYLTRQAYVRAKVASFLSDDPAINDETKEEAKTTAKDYYRLAWEYTKHHQGKLILMSGLSGSGKTTVARYLAKSLNAIHIRSDAVRKHLAGIPLQQKGSEEIYTSEMTTKTYKRLLELGKLLTSLGFSVILDARYEQRNRREQVIAWTKAEKIPLQIIHCSAPLVVLSDRLAERQTDISDATTDLLSQQQMTTEEFNEAEKPYLIEIDTTLANWQELIIEKL